MSKTPTERMSFSGPTMGTRWSVQLDSRGLADAGALQIALQAAVDEVDAQMSTWKPDSDLMRLNAAPCGEWVPLPERLMTVLAAGLQISSATGGAFEMNVGDAVRAWGFGAGQTDLAAIRAASGAARIAAVDALEMDLQRGAVRKSQPLALDLSGIAKGYGVDCLVEAVAALGHSHALCAIDGEVRALGGQADGRPWSVAVETPDDPNRLSHSVLALVDGAVATSGDYRKFLRVAGQRLSHTIDPGRGAPVVGAPASVSVVAADCMTADALATALMVMREEPGLAFARKNYVSALFLTRDSAGMRPSGTGIFADQGALA